MRSAVVVENDREERLRCNLSRFRPIKKGRFGFAGIDEVEVRERDFREF